MDTEHLKTASEHATYVGIVVGTLSTAFVWSLTRIKKLKDWQVSVMKKTIKEVFEVEILPTVMMKDECSAQHRLTDTNIMHIRDDVKMMNTKLDMILEKLIK